MLSSTEKTGLTGLNHNESTGVHGFQFISTIFPSYKLINKLRPTCAQSSCFGNPQPKRLQRMLRKVGNRWEAVTRPFEGAPAREAAAAGSLRQSDGVAAAAAAAACAVKFMLIESEAAATSTSFLPAQFSHLLFLRSSQPGPPLSSFHPKLHASLYLVRQEGEKKTQQNKQNKETTIRGRNRAT